MVAIRRTIAGRNSCPLGHARREPFRNSKEQTDCCLLYLTERRFQRQFGAKTSAPWIPECLGASGRARCLAECGSAVRIKDKSSLASRDNSAHVNTTERCKIKGEA